MVVGLGPKRDPMMAVASREFPDAVKGYVALQLFWYGILNTLPKIGAGPQLRHIALAFTICLLHFCAVPSAFGFTYINAVLYFVNGITFLTEKKGPFYTHFAVLFILPNMPMMWVEAVACDSFLINYGGHFWFDFMVPIMTLLYFFVVR